MIVIKLHIIELIWIGIVLIGLFYFVHEWAQSRAIKECTRRAGRIAREEMKRAKIEYLTTMN